MVLLQMLDRGRCSVLWEARQESSQETHKHKIPQLPEEIYPTKSQETGFPLCIVLYSEGTDAGSVSSSHNAPASVSISHNASVPFSWSPGFSPHVLHFTLKWPSDTTSLPPCLGAENQREVRQSLAGPSPGQYRWPYFDHMQTKSFSLK